jgi:hypothetical protein
MERGFLRKRFKLKSLSRSDTRGKLPRNPGLRARDPAAIAKAAAARNRAFTGDVIASMD